VLFVKVVENEIKTNLDLIKVSAKKKCGLPFLSHTEILINANKGNHTLLYVIKKVQ